MASHYDADGPILRLHVMKPTDRSGGFYREWSKSHGSTECSVHGIVILLIFGGSFFMEEC